MYEGYVGEIFEFCGGHTRALSHTRHLQQVLHCIYYTYIQAVSNIIITVQYKIFKHPLTFAPQHSKN